MPIEWFTQWFTQSTSEHPIDMLRSTWICACMVQADSNHGSDGRETKTSHPIFSHFMTINDARISQKLSFRRHQGVILRWASRLSKSSKHRKNDNFRSAMHIDVCHRHPRTCRVSPWKPSEVNRGRRKYQYSQICKWIFATWIYIIVTPSHKPASLKMLELQCLLYII